MQRVPEYLGFNFTKQAYKSIKIALTLSPLTKSSCKPELQIIPKRRHSLSLSVNLHTTSVVQWATIGTAKQALSWFFDRMWLVQDGWNAGSRGCKVSKRKDDIERYAIPETISFGNLKFSLVILLIVVVELGR